jgi:NADH-quinone oxidoreductase subunit K
METEGGRGQGSEYWALIMQELLFYLFAGLTLGSGILVVANPWSRNPVTSAMFLVVSIVSLAGLFVLLHAFFLAAIQILVYAGAVMVLFLFVIMMLDLKVEQRRKVGRITLITGLVAVGALAALLLSSIYGTVPGSGLPAPMVEGNCGILGTDVVSRLPVAVRGAVRAAVGGDDRRDSVESKGAAMSGVGLEHYLTVSALLFCVGLLGVIVRRNLLIIFMSLELMLNAASLALIAFSRFNNDLNGQVLVFFIITVAAAEVAVGLALIVALYRRRRTAHVEELVTLKL